MIPAATTVFAWSNQLMLPLWLLLALALFVPRMAAPMQRLAWFGLPVLLGLVYSLALLSQLPADGGFGSLASVRQLFANDWLLLAGWVHYLAFDFFVGAWVVGDALKLRVWRPLVLPCLVGCFLAGPLGLLAYLLLRGLHALRPLPEATT